MGHGAPRELGGNEGPVKDLGEEDAKALEAALRKFETADPAFKSSREDEKHQQTSKAWTARCIDAVEELRSIGKAIVASHQVLLDMGQDGAGVGASPWIEEAGLKFQRMHFRLQNDGSITSECGGEVLAKAPDMYAADYDWLEKAVVKWLISQANK